jgi:hypothetical protein
MLPKDVLPRLSHAAQIRANQSDVITGHAASPPLPWMRRMRVWPVNRTGLVLTRTGRSMEVLFPTLRLHIRNCRPAEIGTDREERDGVSNFSWVDVVMFRLGDW